MRSQIFASVHTAEGVQTHGLIVMPMHLVIIQRCWTDQQHRHSVCGSCSLQQVAWDFLLLSWSCLIHADQHVGGCGSVKVKQEAVRNSPQGRDQHN